MYIYTESNARRQLVEEYRLLMFVATLFLFVSLSFVCASWFIVLQTGKLGGKPVFYNFLLAIACSVVCSLYVMGMACFVYLLATGREDMAWEWSRSVIVKFIFRTAEANALFKRYRKAAARRPPSMTTGESATAY